MCALLFLSPLGALAELGDLTPRDLTLIFVGGSGGDGATPTLSRLHDRLAALDPKSAVVVFTGNYSTGELPASGDPHRAKAESDARAHVAATAGFVKRGGQVFFLPGHQDFAEGGTAAVKRLRKFLNTSFAAAGAPEGLDLMPEAACGTPTMIELTDNVGLLLVNSQWWMQETSNDPKYNEGCEAKTRKAFQGNLMDKLREYRIKRLIVASHHPLSSYGQLGGAFTLGAHFTPAPIVGTALVLARQSGLVPQYQNHPLVHSYVELVRNEADRNGAYVFASGHDANLQYVAIERQAQLISGTSAARAEPVAGVREGDFAAATPGWVELAIAASGQGTARFFGAAAEPLFEKPLPDLALLAPVPTEPAPPLPQSPVLAGYSKHPVWNFPGFVALFAGSYYADAFQLRQPYPVLDLTTEQGGLQPFKISGGLQTNSIRVHDRQGGDWAIRSTTKDSSRLLPYPLNQVSFLSRLLDHGFTATHPEAAVAMPALATAVGVLHQRPRLMYLPDQEALGEYRGFVTNEVVLLELRPKELDDGLLPEHLAGPPPAEGKTTFKDYDEMTEKLLEHPEKHRVDQEAVLRARLLDMVVGDWDRHRGQWAFAITPNPDGTKTYRPIARDRDQMFGNYDGIGLAFTRMVVPQARSLQPFNGSYGRIGWLNYNARDFDALMLNTIEHDRWLAIAAEVQAALTDTVIDEAMATWHPEAYALNGAFIAASLKLRRDTLLEASEEFFAIQASAVDIVGSAQSDRFDLWFEDDGSVRVTVKPTEPTQSEPYYQRRFKPAETDQLRIYALEGDDTLTVHGKPHTDIGIRFVGGEGADFVAAAGGPRDEPVKARALHLYDDEQGAKIDPSISVSDRRSSLARDNQYEQRENHEPDFGMFMPGLLVNPDDGVYLGGKYTHVLQGYKKVPFGARHDLSAYFATATLGAAVEYHGLFPQSADLLDQQLDLALKTPQFTRNFYGLTNAYVEDGEAPDFYRVRQAQVEARYGLSYGFGGDRTRVGAQVLGQILVTENTPGRFLGTSLDVTPDVFGPRYFAGARVFAETNTFDSLTLPRRGVALHASVEGRYDVQRGNQLSMTYKGAAATAIPIDRNQRFVVLTRATVEAIVGDHPFYFAPTLGEPQLRAYHRQQLAGDAAFAHSTDLRIDVLRIASVVPGTIGVNLSVDHGRVFGVSAGNDDYHFNYGGGLWWSIVDLIGVAVNYHRGLDGGERLSLSVGPLFTNTGF